MHLTEGQETDVWASVNHGQQAVTGRYAGKERKFSAYPLCT